ncbi:hypothetical protein, partial [Photorhabdus bodei]|uniref:hypothetical protein n=1 Tax=Photorhabdus bodei TaxID=2029681 RepID=UPI001EE4C082
SKLAAVYCPRPTLLHWLRPARSRRLLARLRTRHLRPIRPRERCLSYTNILTRPLVIELLPHRLIPIKNTT